MRDLDEKIIEMLKTTSKPTDINEDLKLLSEEEHPLAIEKISQEAADDFSAHRIFSSKLSGGVVGGGFTNLRRTEGNRRRDNMPSSGNRGSNYNDSRRGGAPSKYDWLIKQKKGSSEEIKITGPYSPRELKIMLERGELENTFLKRQVDECFIPYEVLEKNVGNFIFSRHLTDYFKKYASDFFSSEIQMEKPSISDDKSSYDKVKQFLSNNNIGFDVHSIIKIVYMKTHKIAVKELVRIVQLDEITAKDLLGIILKDSNKQILLDVDQDGYFIASTKKRSS